MWFTDLWLRAGKRLCRIIIIKNVICCDEMVQGAVSYSKRKLIQQSSRYLVGWVYYGRTVRQTAFVPGLGFSRSSSKNHICIRNTHSIRYEIYWELKCNKIYKIPSKKNKAKLVKAFPEYNSPSGGFTKQNVNIQPWQAIFGLIMLK